MARVSSNSPSPSKRKSSSSPAKKTSSKSEDNDDKKVSTKKLSTVKKSSDSNSFKVKAANFLLSIAHYNDKIWFPLILISVSLFNSMTGGAFVWCVGLLQATLFGMTCFTPRYTFIGPNVFSIPVFSIPGYIVGPLCLTTGASITAITYMRMLESESAEYVLEYTGAKSSKWLETVRDTASSYGGFGLFLLQVAPVPIPTAVIVTAGKLADIDNFTIFSVVIGSKFCQLLLSAQVMLLNFGADGTTTVEGYLKKQFKDAGVLGEVEMVEKKDE